MSTLPATAEPSETLEHKQDTSTLGMWVFLASEVMFFGALFLGYTVYKATYPDVFAAASAHLNTALGSINTAVLLISSMMMAFAVNAAQTNRRGRLTIFLLVTALLGIAFLGIKGIEYYGDYREHLMPMFGLPFVYNGASPEKARLFFDLYYITTGLHAVHLTIGIIIVGIAAFLARRGHFDGERFIPIELIGLYWHFVDIVWVFLFPLLYLLKGRS